ncbi:MAG: AAA family ATPase, partial [Clostridiales bacterium]|nr:AAA family ATPase [Clostridiales bacterium]
MKINKLDINGFGKFNGSSITLSEGVNIVYGSNEAGKSTLQLFIKAMFYGMKGGRATKEGIPAQLNRLKPWGGGSYAGVLEYSLENGQNFRVERDFEKGTAIVYDSSFNDVSGCFPALRDKLPLFAEKHIGLPEDCFEKTIFIRQLDTKLEGESSGGLLVRLANISQTGYEDISFKKAEQLLKEEIKKNIGTGRTTAQPADKLEARLGELRTERTAAAAKREAGLVNTKRLSQLREEYDRKQKEKAFLREAGELIAVRKALDGKKAAVKALKNVLEDIRVIREEIASAELERRAAGEGALGGARSRASIKRENKRRKRILIYTATALAATAAA